MGTAPLWECWTIHINKVWFVWEGQGRWVWQAHGSENVRLSKGGLSTDFLGGECRGDTPMEAAQHWVEYTLGGDTRTTPDPKGREPFIPEMVAPFRLPPGLAVPSEEDPLAYLDIDVDWNSGGEPEDEFDNE